MADRKMFGAPRQPQPTQPATQQSRAAVAPVQRPAAAPPVPARSVQEEVEDLFPESEPVRKAAPASPPAQPPSPEAPAKPNVTYTFTTRVEINGREGELSITAPSAREMRKALALLSEWTTPVLPPAQTTPDGRPICRKHGVAMTLREKQGDRWYSHNVGSEANPCWCKGYAGPDSPGWEVA